MRTPAKLHLHAAGRRRAAASARWAASPAPVDHFFENMPDELQDSPAAARWNEWMMDDRLDPETGKPLPGEEFTTDELADLASAREAVNAEGRFKRAITKAAKIPFFALFSQDEMNGDADDASQIVRHQPGREESPPPPASPGGRSLPIYCLTPHILSQRPILSPHARVE